MSCSHCTKLRDDRDELAERVRQLEQIIFDRDWVPPHWRLTTTEVAIVNLLAVRAHVTKEHLEQVLYGDRSDGGPSSNTINTHLCHIRLKLRPLGGTITAGRSGWALEPSFRLLVLELRKAA